MSDNNYHDSDDGDNGDGGDNGDDGDGGDGGDDGDDGDDDAAAGGGEMEKYPWHWHPVPDCIE